MSDKVVNLVAVRMKSKRLPNKAFALLCGRPILWHVVDRVTRALVPEETIICTSTIQEDDPIANFAEENGFALFRGDPDDVLLRFIGAAENAGAQHVVRITGDNPLTDPDLIDAMSSFHLAREADYTFTGGSPRGTRPEIISLSALKKCHKLAEDPKFSEYMTLYFRDHPQVFSLAKYACPEHICRPQYLVTVDTPADLKVVKEIYEVLYVKDRKFSLVDVIEYLDAHPEIDHKGRGKMELNISEINVKLRLP